MPGNFYKALRKRLNFHQSLKSAASYFSVDTVISFFPLTGTDSITLSPVHLKCSRNVPVLNTVWVFFSSHIFDVLLCKLWTITVGVPNSRQVTAVPDKMTRIHH